MDFFNFIIDTIFRVSLDGARFAAKEGEGALVIESFLAPLNKHVTSHPLDRSITMYVLVHMAQRGVFLIRMAKLRNFYENICQNSITQF